MAAREGESPSTRYRSGGGRGVSAGGNSGDKNGQVTIEQGGGGVRGDE